MITLLETLLIVGCILGLGVSLWVLWENLLTVDVPPAISHPVKLRILFFLMQLTMTWGYILEKLGVCSMPHFARFVQDIVNPRRNSEVLVTNLRFGTIPVRLFQPKAASSSLRRGILFFHGGGATFGSLDSYHTLCSFLARETDSVVLSVGYRKLPEYHYPVISMDTLSASIHFLRTLKVYGVDPSRVIACGESIGGGAVATLTQALVGRTDLPNIRAQIMIYPVTQAINFQLPTLQQNQNIPLLPRKLLMQCVCKYLAIDLSWQDAMLKGACIPPDFWCKYKKWLSSDNLPKRFRSKDQPPETPASFNEVAYLETKHILDSDNSPLIADDKTFAQLPEALLVTCEMDVLRDDGLLYKKRLEDQGVQLSARDHHPQPLEATHSVLPHDLPHMTACFLQASSREDEIDNPRRNPEVLVTNLHFGTIPVRLFQPKAASSSLRRGILFFHGGGSMFGSLGTASSLNEYHYRVISMDILSASIHFLRTLKVYGVDPSRVIACGESIGGGAVATFTQALVGRTDLPNIRAQIMIYPITQAINFQLPSVHQNQNIPLLPRKLLMQCVCKYLAIDLSWQDAMLKGACIPPDFWCKYKKWLSSDNLPKRFRSKDQPPETPASFNEVAYLETKHIMDIENLPLIADDKILTQLPEAFLVTCEMDVLRDNGLLYKKRLEDQGVRVTWYHAKDGFHGCLPLFNNKVFFFPCALNIMNAVVSYIKDI